MNNDRHLDNTNPFEKHRVAILTTLGIIVLGGAVILGSTNRNNEKNSAPPAQNPKETPSPYPTPGLQNSATLLQETAEWPANVFKDPNMNAVIGRTVAGNTYVVECRIPPNPEQPASVAGGGWYWLMPSKSEGLSTNGVVAANTFDNGKLPNNNPYDRNVSVCAGQ